MTTLGYLVLLCSLALMTQRWFWCVALFFASMASLFAMIASIIHFQILGALGFFVLTAICAGILGAVSSR